MKKIFAVLLAALLVLTLAACGGNSGGNANGGSGNIEGSVEELLNKITDGATDPDMMLMTSQVTDDDTFRWQFFIEPVEGAEAWVSEPMMNAIAHFVGLIRVPEGTDPAAVASDIEANLNPMKWVCVEPEKTAVVRRGDLVLVVMSTADTVTAVVNNFNGL